MRGDRSARRRRLLAPEVVQTSNIDCGPAALQCLLAGHRLPASYGRLREACRTDVDGTSIDTIEEVATDLGLDAVQVVRPADHLLLAEPELLPAVVVVRQPGLGLHFVVAWRRFGPLLQLMDPATGRRWTTARAFLPSTYVHALPVAAAGWRAWAAEGEMLAALGTQLREAGLPAGAAEALLAEALADPGWRPLATLEAAARLARSLVEAGALPRGRDSARLLTEAYRAALERPDEARTLVPLQYWSVEPAAPPGGAGREPEDVRDTGDFEEPGEEILTLRGAVLVRVRGVRETARHRVAPPSFGEGPPKPGEGQAAAAAVPGSAPGSATGPTADRASQPVGESGTEPGSESDRSPEGPRHGLSAELAEAVRHEDAPAWRVLLDLLRRDGLTTPAVLAAAFAVTGVGMVAEALLLRGFLDLARLLGLPEQRLGAILALGLFFLALAGLELPATFGALATGRRLEGRLRLAFLRKIPRLGDRFFHSRPVSDMAERSHMVHALRALPELAGRLLRGVVLLVATAAGLVWLAPASAPQALLLVAVSLGVPLVAQRFLAERDLQARTHAGALARFYLDVLLGAAPVRSHGAGRSVAREHEDLLMEQARAARSLLTAAVTSSTVQSLLGIALAAWMVASHLATAGEAGTMLLFVYWALQLPALGQETAIALQQYPGVRNIVLRQAEPLGAPEEQSPETGSGPDAGPDPGADAERDGVPDSALRPARSATAAERAGAAVELAGVEVRIAGHTVLTGFDLTLAPGEQVAVVGRSGAGKSSLLGLLLGWNRPSAGTLRVDGQLLDPAALHRLRRATAWVDPAVRLWRRSLLDNLRYGTAPGEVPSVLPALTGADLMEVVEKLQDGLATNLGEGGARLSGGEGQRVRIGRALLRPNVRLVLLDEAFRGLEADRRRELLDAARERWRGATLLCVTHDVADSRRFDRVLVVDEGRLVEDGAPDELAARGGLYAELLAADREVAELWSDEGWRRLRLAAGRLEEGRLEGGRLEVGRLGEGRSGGGRRDEAGPGSPGDRT